MSAVSHFLDFVVVSVAGSVIDLAKVALAAEGRLDVVEAVPLVAVRFVSDYRFFFHYSNTLHIRYTEQRTPNVL